VQRVAVRVACRGGRPDGYPIRQGLWRQGPRHLHFSRARGARKGTTRLPGRGPLARHRVVGRRSAVFPPYHRATRRPPRTPCHTRRHSRDHPSWIKDPVVLDGTTRSGYPRALQGFRRAYRQRLGRRVSSRGNHPLRASPSRRSSALLLATPPRRQRGASFPWTSKRSAESLRRAVDGTMGTGRGDGRGSSRL
jgi:hypothetical protein